MTAPWKVAHMQVTEPADVELEPAYHGLCLFLWHKDLPLGHVEFLASELPLSEAQIRSLIPGVIAPAVRAYLPLSPGSHMPADLLFASPLGRITEMLQDCTTGPTEALSLVICTRNRPRQLERCLRSVSRQTCPPAEIIVVDNGGDDPETQRVCSSFDGVRRVVEKTPGLSRARNTGLRNASFPLIAFTDDDIEPSPNWLRHLAGAFRDPAVTAASGLVLPAELRTDAQLFFEKDFGGFNQGYEPRMFGPDFVRNSRKRAAPVWSICAGGNMAIRRSTIDKTGLFDERLGAGASGCSEDSEYWYRILDKGGACAYVPAAVVYHYHREDMASLRSQLYLYMRGHVAALLAQYGYSGRWSNLNRILLELPLGYARIFLHWLVTGDSNDRILLDGARGSAAGLWYWLIRRGQMARG
jgi:GT2 family glycosyltransferase